MVLSLIDNCLHMEWTLEHVVEASGYWVQLEFTKVRERWKQRKLLDQMKLNINRISANSLFGLHSTFAPRSWPRRWPWVRQRDNSCSQLCSGSRDPPTAECMHTWNCLRLQSAYHIDWNESTELILMVTWHQYGMAPTTMRDPPVSWFTNPMKLTY